MDNRHYRQNQESNYHRPPLLGPGGGNDDDDDDEHGHDGIHQRIGGRHQRIAQELYRPPGSRRTFQNVDDGRNNHQYRPATLQSSISAPYTSFNFFPLNSRHRPNYPYQQNIGSGGGHRFTGQHHHHHHHHQWTNSGKSNTLDDGDWRKSNVRPYQHQTSGDQSTNAASESNRLTKIVAAKTSSSPKENEKPRNGRYENNLKKFEFDAADDESKEQNVEKSKSRVIQKYDLINFQDAEVKIKQLKKRLSLESFRSKTSFADLAKRAVVTVKNDEKNVPENENDGNEPKMKQNSVLTNIGGIVKIRMPQPFTGPRPDIQINQPKFIAKEMPARLKFNDTQSSALPKSGGLIRLNLNTIQSLNDSNNDGYKSAKNRTKFDSRNEAYVGFESMLNLLRQKIKRSWPNEIRHTDPEVWSLRSKIMWQCEQFLLTDLSYLTIGNVLSHTWEFCFYEFIKLYRMDSIKVSLYQQHKANMKKEEMYDPVGKPFNKLFKHLTKEGLNYFESLYRNLLKRYEITYRMLLERHKYYKIDSSLNSFLHDCTYVVKIIFIYNGDLWRYIENDSSQTFSALDDQAAGPLNSKFYYMRAHMLVPKNAHICSQLALVSFYQKNYFDAIYFYLIQLDFDLVHDRCAAMFWSKSIKFASNRQNLVVFFDYVRTAYYRQFNMVKKEHDDALEKSKCKQRRWQRGHRRINKNYRMEYWIQPDNLKHISKCDMYNFYDLAAINTNESDPDLLEFYQKEVLPKYSFEEVRQNFIISFLSVHGMLNYRTGLDCFYDICNQMILEFERLLQLSFDVVPSGKNLENSERISSFFLAQLFVISMYSVGNTFSDDFYDSASYGFTHSNAYFTMSTLISIILKRLIKTFKSFQKQHEQYIKMFISDPATFAKKFNHKDVEPQSIEDLFGSVQNTMLVDDENEPAKSQEHDDDKGDANDTDETKFNPSDWIEFYTLLPCCKLWCDWVLSFNPYFPPQELNDIKTSIEQNIWQIFAEFLTLINKFITRYPVEFHVRDKTKNIPGRFDLNLSTPEKEPDRRSNSSFELVRLPEDYCLEGFKLLSDSPESSRYVKKPFVPEIVYIYMRLETIRLTGDYLRGLNNPILLFDRQNCLYHSCVQGDTVENKPGLKLKQIQQKHLMDRMNRYKKDFDLNPSFLNTKQDEDLDEEEIYSDEEQALEEMKNLNLCPTERRKLLQYRMFRKQSDVQGKYFKIIEHIKEPKRRFVIIPKYVVFDTNCFLNDIEAIKRLAQMAPFTVTVPLIVVQELKHIANRVQKMEEMGRIENEDEIKRLKQLSMKAEKVLRFLYKVFDVSEHSKKKTSGSDDSDDQDDCSLPYNVKAVTSKGHLLDRIDYKEDFYDPNAYNNDDLVLYACDYLVSRDSYKDSIPSDQSMRDLLEDGGECFFSSQDEYVYRDVVMVTDDMNLRLKSLGYDVPVKKLKQFLQWTRNLKQQQQS